MSKLEEMLKYVSEHNDFYKNRIKEYGIKDPLDITQWPVLTRKELQENRYNMFSDGYKSKYFNQQLIRQSSSGATGMPVNVYWDYKDWYASNMSLWRKRLQWYGIKPSDKYVMFTLNAFGIKNDGETIYYINDPKNILSINVSLIQDNSGYDKLVDIINEFQPKWLYIQPFVLNKLIQAFKRTEKTPPKTLKYIESVGELLSYDLRRRTIEFFNVSLSNMYGSEEMNGIAYECPDHNMYVLDDNVFIEIKNGNKISLNGEGEAVITSLNNIAMPLIRYIQNDSVVIENNKAFCECNNTYPIIKLIKGRTLNCISLIDGGEISPLTLLEIISEVNNRLGDIIEEYSFIYDNAQRLLQCFVYISSEKFNWRDAVHDKICGTFKRKTFASEKIRFKINVIASKDYKINEEKGKKVILTKI